MLAVANNIICAPSVEPVAILLLERIPAMITSNLLLPLVEILRQEALISVTPLSVI